MTPKKRLIKLRVSACTKMKKLDRKLSHALTLSVTEREPLVAYIAIESLNSWTNFLRTLYLSCTIQAKSTKGKRISTGVATANFNDAIGIAINYYRPTPLIPPSSGIWDRRNEPSWHDVNNLTRSCQAVSCTYVTDIQSALSIGTKAYEHLPIIRNYYAHRNDSTAQKVRNIAPYYGISPLLLPTDIMFSHPIASHRTLLQSILDDLIVSIEFLCEGL